MIFLTIMALPLVMAFIAFRSRMIGVYALATASWVTLWFYINEIGIPGIAKGSNTESALMLICIGASIMVLLVGVGSWQSRKQASKNGIEATESWQMPAWLKGENETNRLKPSETVEEYRERIRNAYHRGRHK